tara:strand:+ start:588 stop:779 length:192 start_codon:yes stop_codon:yes gene_type:complete
MSEKIRIFDKENEVIIDKDKYIKLLEDQLILANILKSLNISRENIEPRIVTMKNKNKKIKLIK